MFVVILPPLPETHHLLLGRHVGDECADFVIRNLVLPPIQQGMRMADTGRGQVGLHGQNLLVLEQGTIGPAASTIDASQFLS